MKKLKTSELLDQIHSQEDDELFGKLLDEIHERTPFDDMWGRLGEVEEQNEKLEEEIRKLRNSMREHNHMPDGTAVKKI